MKDYNEILNELIFQIERLTKKYNLDSIKLIHSTSESHKLFHEEFLVILGQLVDDLDDLDFLYRENSKMLRQLWIAMDGGLKEGFEYCNRLISYCDIIHKYLGNFHNKYFSIQNNEPVLNKKEIFELPVSNTREFEDMDINFKYITAKLGSIYTNENRELCLLILTDGTCYNALNDHATLARWLNMNGIDIDNAIRFEASRQFNNFDFCSLNNFGFSEKSNDNEFIQITPAQAIAITDLYKALSSGWRFIKPFDKCLEKTTGFGFGIKDYRSGLGERNLSIISEYAKGYFDDYDYLRYLKTKANEHNPIN